MKKPATNLFLILISSSLLLINTSLAAKTKTETETEAKTEPGTEKKQETIWKKKIQPWGEETYHQLSKWTDEQYQQHPEWKNWLNTIIEKSINTKQLIENYIANINQHDDQPENSLSVPTKQSQAQILNNIGNDSQLDPLESPEPLKPVIVHNNKQENK